MKSLIAVMRQGSQATKDQITDFKEARASTSLQIRAMNELTAQYRAANPMLTMFSRSMASLGAIGSTVMSMTNTLILSQINLGIAQNNVATATTNAQLAQQQYYAAQLEFGPTDARTLKAKQDMISAENVLRNTMAQSHLVQIQTTMAYVGMGLSVSGLVSQIVTAVGTFNGFSKLLTGAGTAAGDVGVGLTDIEAAAPAAEGAMTTLEGDSIGLAGAMDMIPIVGLVAGLALLGYGVANTIGQIQKLNEKTGNTTQSFKDLLKQQQANHDYLGEFVTSFTYGLYLIGDGVVTFVKLFIKTFQKAWTDIKEGWKTFWNDLKQVGQTIGAAVGTAVKVVLNGIIGFLNIFVNGIDDIIKGINAAASVLHLPTLGLIPNIPSLATGGIVTRPTIAQIGEAGPEAIVPLSGSNAGAATGGTYSLTINAGLISTEQEIGKYIDQLLLKRYSLRRRTS